MPKVSVVIPTYNCAEFLPDAIESVLKQSFRDVEIVVVDDESTDETMDVLRAYVDTGRIRYLAQANQGPAAARNRGFRNASGEYIAVLDADDRLPTESLQRLLEQVCAAGASWCMTDIAKFWGEWSEIQKTDFPVGDLRYAILRDDFIRRAMFFRKQTLERIGGWDESLWAREDWDINIRLIHSDEPFIYIQQPLYAYRKRPGSITTAHQGRVLRNTERLLRKHHKVLADRGDSEIAGIYAANMWSLARAYFYDQRDIQRTWLCARESLRYEVGLKRLVHPVIHKMRRVIRQAS